LFVEFRRRFVAAVLVYVALDLSLAAMPGAFVFDAADSVESIRFDRGRGLPEVEVMALSALQPALFVASLPRLEKGTARANSTNEAVPREQHDLANHRPRAGLDSPPTSEDPH
jgi:hypothetical protein